MASARTTFFLLVLAFLGGGYLWFFEPHLESTGERRELAKRLLHVRADQITTLALRRDAFTSATVERIDGATFKRTLPDAGGVDSAAVNALCSELEFGEHRALLEGRANDTQALYDDGLSPPHLTVTLTLADRREVEFELGGETSTKDGVYLHVRDDPNLQVAAPALRDALDRLLDQLTDTNTAPKSDGAAGTAPKGDG